MKKHLLPVFLSAILISLAACSGNKTETTADQPMSNAVELASTKGWTLLDTMDFSIAIPPEWTIDMSHMMGTEFIAFSPVDTARPEFRTNLSYISQDFGGEQVGLEEYLQNTISQLRAFLNNDSIIDIVRAEGYDEMVYSATQGEFDVTFLQRFFIRDGAAHVLTATSISAYFDEVRPLLSECFDSFELDSPSDQ